ncbi:MAG TPA: hypothetical protein DCE78_01960 [Bacteroidetes bacterium]|nr:hypothetical protein [Bacteroidota bacterium]
MFQPDQICTPEIDFHNILHQIMMYQVEQNQIYKRYLDGLYSRDLILFGHPDLNFISSENIDPDKIPLLPVEAFRDAKVYAEGDKNHELEFRSSGTTTSIRSRHYVAFKSQYEAAIFNGFNYFYNLNDFVILAYTPGYIANPNSSLIWMLNALIGQDQTGMSRFLEVGMQIDEDVIQTILNSGKNLMLFGAAFGLIEMAENFPIKLPSDSIIMETGGMKTHRKEMTRDQMHKTLANGFGLQSDRIHSEYGMTELLSQAYSLGDYWFKTPPWMQISIRNRFNPMESMEAGQEGLIGVIDLANWASCPFILTGDLGVKRTDGAFQVLGRVNKHHLRGCNFLLEVD